MRKYLLKRFLSAIPMLFFITIITFLIINAAPGGPATMFVKPGGHTELTAEEIEWVNAILGVDKPVLSRYVNWLGQIVVGNLGYSYSSGLPVMDEILSRLAPTLALMGITLTLSVLIGVWLGFISAKHQNSWKDRLISFIAMLGLSLPEFWFALMLLVLFAGRLGWLPSIGLTSTNLVNPTFWVLLLDRAKHMVLPVFVLTFSSLAKWSKYQRGAVLDVINQDYVRTAKAKGMSEAVIDKRHVFRNSALPIVTLLGTSLPSLFSGAIIIEAIFALPGTGRYFLMAISSRDYPVIMGQVLITSVLILLGTLLADILYTVIDPRIRYSE